jgi:hypothetical protein
MKTYLKIKIKHLAEEAQVIKFEKAKWMKKAAKGRAKAAEKQMLDPAPAWMFNAVHEHRVNVVRPEVRDSNLAYGFLRGKSYAHVEASRYTDPNWTNVLAIVKRFYNPRYRMNVDLDTAFAEWKAAAPPISKRKPRTPRGQRIHRSREEWEKKQNLQYI